MLETRLGQFESLFLYLGMIPEQDAETLFRRLRLGEEVSAIAAYVTLGGGQYTAQVLTSTNTTTLPLFCPGTGYIMPHLIHNPAPLPPAATSVSLEQLLLVPDCGILDDEHLSQVM